MGGCRCTYRYCTVRSDGKKTHLFHYPVFDKVRCHQWLMNGQRYDLLNLTVSQLKNRVVCQHHFKDEMFMNFKKDKLKHNAVPTENGPYCTDIYNVSSNEEKLVFAETPVTTEDIEPETLSFKEKKTQFPVKYVDFLQSEGPSLDFQEKQEKKDADNKITISVPYLNNITPGKKQMRRLGKPSSAKKKGKSVLTTMKQENVTKPNSNNKIKIISMKKISDPIDLIKNAKLTKISAADVVTASKAIEVVEPVSIEQKPEQATVIPIDFVPSIIAQQLVDIQNMPIDIVADISQLNIQNDGKENTSDAVQMAQTNTIDGIALSQKKQQLMAGKVTVAKSKDVGVKLKSLIASEVNQQDDAVKIKANVKKKLLKEINTEKEHLQSHVESCQPKVQDGLETRLVALENSLISKIEQNTHHILELRQLMLAKQTDGRQAAKTISTQTMWPEEGHKKQLFNQISDFLSADLKSRLYEELFINQYDCHSSTEESGNRRSKRKKYK